MCLCCSGSGNVPVSSGFSEVSDFPSPFLSSKILGVSSPISASKLSDFPSAYFIFGPKGSYFVSWLT